MFNHKNHIENHLCILSLSLPLSVSGTDKQLPLEISMVMHVQSVAKLWIPMWEHIMPIKLTKNNKNKETCATQECFRVLISWNSSALMLFTKFPSSCGIWKHPSQTLLQGIEVDLTQQVATCRFFHPKGVASSWATPFRLAASKSSWGIFLSNEGSRVHWDFVVFFPKDSILLDAQI